MLDIRRQMEILARRTIDIYGPKDPFSIRGVRLGGGTVLAEWIERLQAGFAPEIFRLVSPDELRATPDLPLLHDLRRLEPQVSRRPESGTLEIQMAKSMEFEPQTLIATIRRLAQEEDARSFSSIQESPSELVLAETESVIENVPVIGPGGRVTIYKGGNWLEADIVVRRRLTPITGQWRPTELILRRLLSEAAIDQENIEISANFGYLELSKYEAQAWLRPAFLFVLRNVSSAKDRVPWAYSLAEPATETKEIPLDEGLGSWAGSETV